MKQNPTCRIYLLRHGEVANAGVVAFNGHHDIELSANGKEQFAHIAEALKEFPIRAVYSSDLSRTRQCAEIIAESHGLPIVPCPELRELSFGEWEGLSVEEVERRFPGLLQERMKRIETFHANGGETYRDLHDRVVPKFNEIVARHPNDSIVIAVHGGVNRVILAHILGIPIDRIFGVEQYYAAVNIIQYYEDTAVVELTNGTWRHIHLGKTENKKVPIQ